MEVGLCQRVGCVGPVGVLAVVIGNVKIVEDQPSERVARKSTKFGGCGGAEKVKDRITQSGAIK